MNYLVQFFVTVIGYLTGCLVGSMIQRWWVRRSTPKPFYDPTDDPYSTTSSESSSSMEMRVWREGETTHSSNDPDYDAG